MTVAARAAENARERIVLGTIGVVAFVLLWEGAARLGFINPIIFSSPWLIAGAFVDQLRSGVLLGDLAVSFAEFGIAFGFAVVIGILLGLAMGMNRWVEYAIDPFVWFLYSVPLIAVYPLIIVWIGFGHATVIAIAFLLAFVSIVVNTMAGVHSVDPQLIRAVRAFGGNQRDVVTKVVLPASNPLIVAGIRIALGRALIGVTLGEMFSSNAGLGFHLTFYAARLKTADVFVPLLTLIAVGIAINQLCGVFQRRLEKWRD